MSDQPVESEVRAAVDRALQQTGLAVDEADYERLLRTYKTIRESAVALRIPEARYAEPAIIHRAG
jgi:hypothetical protein